MLPQTIEIVNIELAAKILGNKKYKKGDEILGYLNGLPVSFMQHGLLQTLTYMKTKKNDDINNLYKSIQKTLFPLANTPFDLIVDHVIKIKDSMSYVSLQNQLLALSVKIKQIANACKQ